jgi:uncharacterized protein DUF3224
MSTTQRLIARGTIEATDWQDEPFIQSLSRPHGVDLYHGDLEAEATWAGASFAAADGSGTFVSLQRMHGRLGDRSGSFVLAVDGAFKGGETHASLRVVPSSGTGGLASLQGDGRLTYVSGGQSSYTLEYSF